MSTVTRKLPVKKVFSAVKPIVSKHVDVHFDRALRVNARTRMDGAMAKIGNSAFAIINFNGESFAVPYTIKTDSKKVDRALGGLLATRGITISKL